MNDYREAFDLTIEPRQLDWIIESAIKEFKLNTEVQFFPVVNKKWLTEFETVYRIDFKYKNGAHMATRYYKHFTDPIDESMNSARL